jgi:hypothetical protein
VGILQFRPAFVAAAIFVSTWPGSAATLSDPAVDAYNVRVGTETFAALYKFTTNSALVETAQAITNLGSDTIKLYLGSNTAGQSGVAKPSYVTNLLTLVRDEPNYHRVLDMPFRHFVLWAYPLENSDEWWGSGYNSTQGAKDYQEMYNLTRYLLTNYNNSGKTFYLGHWEGDGYLSVNNWSTNPSMTTVHGMIGWLNNRQKAVDDAKQATAHTNVQVYNYSECNRVRDAMLNNSNNNVRVINYVIPYVTNLDVMSYSSYDSQNLSTSDLYATLNYMESMLPTNKAAVVPGPRIWIGEYGWGYKSVAAQEPLDRAYIQRLLGWSWNGKCLPFLLFWEMYSNYNPNGATNYCLIDYTGAKVPSWYLQHYFLNAARMLTAQFKESNGRLPTDTEFSALTMPLLNQPLTAPVTLAVTNGHALPAGGTTAVVSAGLAQGVYGDDRAALWVFWGRHDGGTVAGNWEQSQLVAINTNFNPVTYSVTLTNLASQTNYFFRFYATNANATAWAPSSASFSTATIDKTAFGSKTKIFFSGYHGPETLTNFPVLVSLGTNVPGFSYRQFASPAGGDLRFAGEDGVTPVPFEIDEWNTNGVSTVWVDVPSLSSTNDFVWACWGNPNATALPPSSTDGSVWPGFDLVWHLKETGFPYADSTLQAPALNGTAPVATAGIIGHGQYFNGTSSFLNAGILDLGPSFTLSAWINIDPSASDIQTIWANKPGGWSTPGFSLYVNSYKSADGRLILETGDGVYGSNALTTAGVVTAGQWHYIVASVDENAHSAQLYVDGANCTALADVDSVFLNHAMVNLGRFTNSTFYFKGIIDEARIQSGLASSNAVLAAWLAGPPAAALDQVTAVSQQQPALTIGASGSLLTWPASGVDFALYTSTNLSAAGTWSLASNQPALINGQWEIDLPAATNEIRFYRLESE